MARMRLIDRSSKYRTATPHAKPSHSLFTTAPTHRITMRSTATHCHPIAASSFLFERDCKPATNQANDATIPPITQCATTKSDHIAKPIFVNQILSSEGIKGTGLAYMFDVAGPGAIKNSR